MNHYGKKAVKGLGIVAQNILEQNKISENDKIVIAMAQVDALLSIAQAIEESASKPFVYTE